jgi:uncharacterized protein (TIGR03067 family)
MIANVTENPPNLVRKERIMRLVSLAIVAILAPWAVAAESDAEARKNLTGKWEGRVDEGATGHQLTINAERIVAKRDGKQDLGEGTFQLDLTTQPFRFDALRTKGPQKGKKYLGIYRLEGDTLKWCVSTPGNDRPTEFATKDNHFLLILKRQ